MQISRRLQQVAEMVTPGNRVADIGCDHAYTAIYLLINRLSPYVVAMDINQGPLDRAKENVEKYGVEDKVSIRKSDGLKMLNPGEVDTILIAGMGGRLTLQILTSRMKIVSAAKELVLQPQSETYLVRKTLKELGYVIIKENMLKEDGKYYVIMKLKPCSENLHDKDYQLLKPEHIYFGRILLEERNPVLLEHLQTERQLYKNIYQELITLPTKQSIQRQTEILDLMGLIDYAISYYKEGRGV
ncbi:MAG: SAM-dependent methyltransferase [Clostridiales bacterium]|jgi:tRNA (adenine22-N1)-methyltransferase|nr:SAM-dependent methyltransferase [Clostridiales bacterium]